MFLVCLIIVEKFKQTGGGVFFPVDFSRCLVAYFVAVFVEKVRTQILSFCVRFNFLQRLELGYFSMGFIQPA